MTGDAAILDVTRPETAHTAGADVAAGATALVATLTDGPILSPEACEHAVREREAIGAMQARVAAYFAPLKRLAYQLWKSLCDRENEIARPLAALDMRKRIAIATFTSEQARIREAAEREAAEQRRRDDADRAVYEAAALETGGDAALAAAVLDEAIAAPAPVLVLPDVTRTIPGLKMRRRWTWRYVDGPADVDATPPAVRERAKRAIPLDFLMIDEVKIGAYARSMKSSGAISGVEIYHVDEPIR